MRFARTRWGAVHSVDTTCKSVFVLTTTYVLHVCAIFYYVYEYTLESGIPAVAYWRRNT